MVPRWFELFDRLRWIVTVQRGEGLRYVFANDEARRLFGGRDVVGMSAYELLPHAQSLLRDLEQTLRHDEPYVGSDQPVTAAWNGTGELETRFLTFFCQAVAEPGTNIQHVIFFAVDVTERVARRSSSARQWAEAALNAIGTPVLIIDPRDRTVIFTNRAATALVGAASVGSTVGRAFGLHDGCAMTYFDGRPISVQDNPVTRAAQGEMVGPIELEWHVCGKTVPLVCFAQLIPPLDEQAPPVILSFFDLTQLEELRAQLARSEMARDEFVQMAAHELRTPLTSIRLQVEAARRKHSDLPGILAVSKAVDRLTQRIEQLIDVSDLRNNTVSLKPERADLLDIAHTASRLLDAQATWAGCAVTVASSSPIYGMWDRSRVTQIIASLVSNAVKFGAGKPVELTCSDTAGEATVSVIDHGIGIAADDRTVIFERFQRRASAAHFGGLGLDLWMARELLNRMGGSIELFDTAGGGATFTCHLPKRGPSLASRA